MIGVFDKKNIILIGFMGVGKSKVGKALAKDLDMFYLDTDALIKTRLNKKIRDIFEENGEKFFRQEEQRVATWFKKNVKNTILSTGGGFCVYVRDIQKLGKIILLHNSFDTIYNRLKSSQNWKKELQKRPLFKSYKEAQKLYEVREEIYKKHANLVIDMEEKSLKTIVQEIKQKI